MASNLHARRRGSHQIDLEELSQSPLGADAAHANNRKRPKRRFLSDELQWALSAVSTFLALGLLLGYFLMHHQHRKVILHALKDPWAHGGAMLRGRAGFRHHFYTGAPRYVTIVMPSVVNPKGRARRLKAIQDTWGPGARSIFVVHNVTEFPDAAHAIISEDSSPEDPYSYPQLLLLPNDMSVEDGLPRLFYTIRTIFEKVNPDFAFFVNDHTFVIPEHLCKYLEFQDPTKDMYAGHALKNSQLEVFNSGAAGYVLSRSTMQKMLAQHANPTDPSSCSSEQTSKWLQGNPGLVTMKCINSVGVSAIDTRAANKWHRFHAFPLTRVVSGKVDPWYLNKHQDMGQVTGFDTSYEQVLSGEDCCSKTTVSFHYVEPMETIALFSVREYLLHNPQLTDPELKILLHAEWPKTPQDIGFYSHGLPKPNDIAGWQQLLTVLRKISTRGTQRDC